VSGLLDIAFSVLVFLVVVGGIVLVHEMGHYWVGRWMKFAIEAFSVGFGPKIWEHKGRTNAWQARWILIGGYVKFVGEMDNPECEVPAGVDPGSVFPRKRRWQRFLVLVAGVGANVLSAYLLFAGLAWYGLDESLRKDQPAVVGYVAENSPAAKVGLAKGDLILSVDGRRVRNWEEAEQEIFTLMSKPYPILAERAGKEFTVTVTPVQVEFLKQPMGVIGVASALPPVVGTVTSPSPALQAGIRPGDLIESVEGRPIEFWDQLQGALVGNTGQSVTLVLRRGSERRTVSLAPRYSEEAKRFLLGVAPQERVIHRYPFPACFAKAGGLIADQSTLAFRTFAKLLQRKMPMSALSGPPTLAYISGEVARTGLYNLLFLVGVISVQIGVFNLLPIPALDGGHILVLGLEAVLRRDLPLIVKEWIMRVGFVLLLLLFGTVILLDTLKFF